MTVVPNHVFAGVGDVGADVREPFTLRKRAIHGTLRVLALQAGTIEKPMNDFLDVRLAKSEFGSKPFVIDADEFQNGFLKDLSRNPRPKRFSYSAYDPRDYGLEFSFVYNYLSGSKGLAFRLNELGYVNLDDETRKKFYEEFIKIANLNENLCREDLPESVFRQIAEKLMLKINKL